MMASNVLYNNKVPNRNNLRSTKSSSKLESDGSAKNDSNVLADVPDPKLKRKLIGEGIDFSFVKWKRRIRLSEMKNTIK